MKHYRNYECWMPMTKSTSRSNTVDFFPSTCDDSTITATDTLSLILEDLLTVLQQPPSMTPFLPRTMDLTNAINSMQSILICTKKDTIHEQMVVPVLLLVHGLDFTRRQPASKQRPTCSSPTLLFSIRTIIRHKFENDQYFEGEITSYDYINDLYCIKYIDGDHDDYTYGEIRKYRKTVTLRRTFSK